MPRRIVLHGDNTLDVPLDPFRRYQQVILTKREIDFLSNPKTDRLINTIDSDYWIIFGVTASSCVKAMVLGLLARQNHVVVAKDACGYWSETEGEHAFRMMSAKGAILATTDEIINGVACDWVAERRLEAARRELRRLKQASSGEDMSDSDVSHEMGVPVTDGAFGGRRRAKPRNGKRNDLTSDLLPTDLLKGRRASNRRATKH